MSNANPAATATSVSVGGVLLVSNDAVTIQQLSDSMQQLDMSPEVCAEVQTALSQLNRRKFDAVIVDEGGLQTRLVAGFREGEFPSTRTPVRQNRRTAGRRPI